MLGVPLIVDGKVTGVLHVGTLNLRRFTDQDVELLQLVADRIALAVHARRQHEHRMIAETLQRSLLPDRFPRMEGIEIAGLYRPAEGGMVGGDWYDVFVLGSDSLCVVVGDIAGRGLPAAIAMARLRNAVRAMAFIDEAPGRTVSHVNDFLLHSDPGVMATVLIGIITPDGTLRYASAGHMPPVLLPLPLPVICAQSDGHDCAVSPLLDSATTETSCPSTRMRSGLAKTARTCTVSVPGLTVTPRKSILPATR